MTRFLVSRIGTMLAMALLATLVVLLIANTVPGDPILAQLGDHAAADPAFVARWRHEYGLDLPLWERYFVLPAIVLTFATIGLITRTTRASMQKSIRQDYVRMRRAKSCRESCVIPRHVLPNALIPISAVEFLEPPPCWRPMRRHITLPAPGGALVGAWALVALAVRNHSFTTQRGIE